MIEVKKDVGNIPIWTCSTKKGRFIDHKGMSWGRRIVGKVVNIDEFHFCLDDRTGKKIECFSPDGKKALDESLCKSGCKLYKTRINDYPTPRCSTGYFLWLKLEDMRIVGVRLTCFSAVRMIRKLRSECKKNINLKKCIGAGVTVYLQHENPGNAYEKLYYYPIVFVDSAPAYKIKGLFRDERKQISEALREWENEMRVRYSYLKDEETEISGFWKFRR